MEKNIIEQNRHQFIYGYDGDKRQQFLTSLEQLYPIKQDINAPMAIYLQDISLPNVEEIYSVDKYKVQMIAREYLNASIAYQIISDLKNQLGLNQIDDELGRYLNMISENKIENISELRKILERTKQFYMEYYKQYMELGESILSIDNLEIPFLDITLFTNKIKKMLKNDSYFAIIIDQQNPIPKVSKQAINTLIGCRINGSISIKVGCEYQNWNNYYDANGNIIENIHDYGTIELDDSYSNYRKKLKI